MRILVIEDDASVREFIAQGLRELGHQVETAADGKQGLLFAASGDFDILVIDRMLPGVDGLAIVRTLRASGLQVPALILSALGEVDDRVEGLRAGGDDYMVKPFALSELAARLEALARRGSIAVETALLEVGDLRIDLLTRAVSRAGQSIQLLPREFQLLEFIARRAGQVVTRTMLLEGVWGYHFTPGTNVIDVHISRLRQKIDRGFPSPMIETIRGAGYCLRAPSA